MRAGSGGRPPRQNGQNLRQLLGSGGVLASTMPLMGAAYAGETPLSHSEQPVESKPESSHSGTPKQPPEKAHPPHPQTADLPHKSPPLPPDPTHERHHNSLSTKHHPEEKHANPPNRFHPTLERDETLLEKKIPFAAIADANQQEEMEDVIFLPPTSPIFTFPTPDFPPLLFRIPESGIVRLYPPDPEPESGDPPPDSVPPAEPDPAESDAPLPAPDPEDPEDPEDPAPERSNHAPQLVTAPADQTAAEDAVFTYVIPADSFLDPENTALTYSVLQADGSALPAWLSFDAATRTLSGTPDQPDLGDLALKVTASDGLSYGETTFRVTVTPTNDAPEISGVATAVTFLENTVNAAPQLLDASLSVADIDSADFSGGSLTVSYASGGGAEDSLSIENQGTGAGQIGFDGTTVTYEGIAIATVSGGQNGTAGASLSLDLNANATPTSIETLLEHLTYANTSDTPNAARTLDITLADGDGGSVTTTGVAINVTAEADAPPAIVGSGIVDQMALQTANPATWSLDLASAFTGSSLTYSIVENYIYGTGDPNAWAAANFLSLDTNTGELTLNRSLLVGDEGAVYLTIRATDSLARTVDESFELFVADPGVISGTTGDDNPLNGTAGSDWIWGDEGADNIVRNTGNDNIHLGEGNDVSNGEFTASSTNKIFGGQGDDSLTGEASSSSDLIYGGDGNDYVRGFSGNDYLYGGNGNDVILPDQGTDAIFGQSGDDRIDFVDATYFTNTDTLSGGTGIDTLRITNAATNALVANFTNSQWDKVSGIEIFELQANAAHNLTFNNDYLIRGDGIEGHVITVDASTINTGVTVNGSGMTDSNYSLHVTGGSGGDSIYGSAGNDTIDGGGNPSRTFFSQFDSFTPDDVVSNTYWLNFKVSAGRTVDLDTYINLTNISSFYLWDSSNVTLTATNTTYTKLGKTNLSFGVDAGSNIYDLSAVTSGKNSDFWFNNGTNHVLAGDGNNNFNVNQDLVGTYTLEGGSSTDTLIDNYGTGALILNLATNTNYSSIEQFTLRGNKAHSLTFDDSYFTRGAGITGNNVTVTYNYSGTATNGMLVDGRLITDSTHKLTVTGDEAADTIYGGTGGDTLNGGNNNDTLQGGLGNDSLIGGSGTDTADYSDANVALTINLTTTTGQVTGWGTDTLSGLEYLIGGSGNDTLTGDTNANSISGGTGNDSLSGGDGNDTLVGGAGNDTLDNVSNTGNDLLYGGDGNDSIYGGAQADTVYAGGGNDTVTGAGTGSGGGLIYLEDGDDKFESGWRANLTIDGGNGADTVDATGEWLTAHNVDLETGIVTGGAWMSGTVRVYNIESYYSAGFNDTLMGSTANNQLRGGSGNDTVSGRSGNDTLMGEVGNDALEGGSGQDTLTGGTGNDTFTFSDLTHSTDAAKDLITDFVRGTDTINLTGLGLSFGALTISNNGSVTTVEDNGSTFAFQLTGVFTLDGSEFTF